jgi:acyl-CoA reductase-like NAD-dependent aldehyde dehydrogenase
VLVQESIYDDLLYRLKNRFEKVRAGSSLDKCNDYGQFINPNEMKTLKDKLAELTFAQVLQFDDCIQDKNLKNLQAPVIITDLETNTDFYQEDVSIKDKMCQIFEFVILAKFN